jgi:hypothetical protein
MKVAPEKQAQPFNRFAVGAIAHGVALGGAGLAAYWSLKDPSLLPLVIAFAVLAGLEGLWIYASRR